MTTTTDTLGLLTVDQVAEALLVPKSRVYDCWRAWGLPAIRVGTHLRFRARDIDAWLETRREQ